MSGGTGTGAGRASRRRAPTSLDVARLAGVSQSTVSYVLTGARPISDATRRRVEEAIEQLGYHPNSGARTLRSRRSGVIGLMVPKAHGNDGPLMEFVGAVAREARRFGYDILLVTAQEGARGIDRVVRTGICEALILMELGKHDERIAPVVDSGLPFVTLGRPDAVPQGSMVDLDFELLGSMVVDRAEAEGCERLLLFGAMDGRRERNEIARFLDGVEVRARDSALEVLHERGRAAEAAERAALLTPDGSRTALFGLTGAPSDLFAYASTGALTDPRRLFIALTAEDLLAISPLLAAVPRVDPRRTEISELAVRELVRLLDGDGAAPRVQLVAPRWLEEGATRADELL
ncbi:LacI family DNA-binding transcriptional regulator [Brachybacterium sp. YJGR34]|uniref:LacI family DNA-binding transcriptional regulator n=1 Tax=Brachybacterium sp. YJGR34 TaxID=2059911 RepID=UPI000E0BB63F|nr:LacI family DNA-binding transcriptional regulator [Brachybacterium sp. YJGR34]